MTEVRMGLLSLACVVAFAACSGDAATAPTINTGTGSGFRFTEAAGTFYKDYTGPQSAQTITVVAQMAGPVFTGGPNLYVWGWDRGGAAATPPPFPDEPNVRFNAVLVVTADPANGTTLTGIIILLNGAAPQPVTPVLIAPDTIAVSFPASMLPSTGFTPAQYTWNLWPRNGLGGTPAAQIGSFIPDNTMASLGQR
jgi:hypothetical protein